MIENSYESPAYNNNLRDPDYFRTVYFQHSGSATSPPSYEFIKWLSPTGEMLVLEDPTDHDAGGVGRSAMRSLKMLFYAFGDAEYGQLKIRVPTGATSGIYASMHVRGFKYGLWHGVPQQPRAYYRHNRFGQFRDMLEPRIDTRTMVPGPESGLGAPIRVRFVDSNNKRVKPSSTESSNLSQRATSSLPYFDGISRNRGPINEAEQLTTIVSF